MQTQYGGLWRSLSVFYWKNCVIALVQWSNYDFAHAFSTVYFYPCYFEMNGLFAPALDVRQMDVD